VLCTRALKAGAAEARVLLELWCFLVSQSRSCGVFFQLWPESQNDRKCNNFVELVSVTSYGNIESVVKYNII
jgi:hypothetical protein